MDLLLSKYYRINEQGRQILNLVSEQFFELKLPEPDYSALIIETKKSGFFEKMNF